LQSTANGGLGTLFFYVKKEDFMQTLNIKVTQQAVILQNKDPVTAENVNQIRCVVELDPAYADLVVRVCMNGQFATVVDGQCFAPPLQEGMCRLGVYGYAVDGEQLVQRISPEPCVFYVRPGSYDPAAVETDAPDPTELESYYAKVQALLKDIGKGVNGTTYTPSVSVAGEISWTNDGGKDNPEPVNIKGPKGDTGPQGAPNRCRTVPRIEIRHQKLTVYRLTGCRIKFHIGHWFLSFQTPTS